ncbi:hemerythrin domain-containing protein [Sporosarcina sp. FSL K6-2383]|uniref:hemerythrin domain-containing protein n=1 Tax=Sporosarcina sp. FSL K6-2383 TaxID=2921556 RepID=UPI00315A4082
MESSNVLFCAPLQQLKDEHQSLQGEMNHFYELIEEIDFETGPTVLQLFTKLYELIFSFHPKLLAHSKLEDDSLFPLMNQHPGEHNRTIEIMEFEHEKAEQHLQDFLSEAAKAITSKKGDEHDLQAITVYAFQAYTTLTQHFVKEEKILFPMAESLLSKEEKVELAHLFERL